MAARRAGRYRLLTIALLLSACGDRGLSPSEALALAEPHLDHFGELDRWTRRALAADPAFRSTDNLEETVFAPVRRDTPVLAVWIERESPERRLSFGRLAEPPKRAEWVRVRDDTLGDLDVTTAKVPDPRRASRAGEAESAVLVRRTAPGSDGATVTVTAAYRTDSDDDG